MFARRFLLSFLLLFATLALGQEASKTILLPEAKTSGGKPLMAALKERQTTRVFSEEKLSEQMLSNLLWAAFGINRPDSDKRTAPSAFNAQEIDIYVAMENGLFLYEPKKHALLMVLKEDMRAQTGAEGALKKAPVNLVYVADFSKLNKSPEKDKVLYSAADTGLICQNVYLFCASEGLGTVVRGGAAKESLAKAMGLREDQKIILAQTVGHPEKPDIK